MKRRKGRNKRKLEIAMKLGKISNMCIFTQTPYIRSLLMVHIAIYMNFQEPLQTKHSPSPAKRLHSQGRESSLTSQNTLRHAVTALSRCMVLPVGM